MIFLLTLFLLSLPQISLSCFTYSCSTLDDQVCATLDNDTHTFITLNEKGCGSGFSCSRIDMENEIVLSKNLMINCIESSDEQVAYNITLNTMVECGIRNVNVTDYEQNTTEFLNNPCVDLCYDEYGGNYTCLCGMDGMSYCLPNKSSGIYDEFWNICDKNDNMIDNKTMQLWEHLLVNFIEMITAPYCADDLFPEIDVPNLDYIIDEIALIVNIGAVGVLVFM
ncbi:hypothetical protein SteCoe_2289 [Stentor coeruleus]|uniref:EGF-like domain-containing protein n=1 Tax=Stentor coeruleus TaxID=5963 RepID=A0A1R2CZT6_9CILI|nr:hypothetical protein SteCoe_2289 [Stentor coeruleus]